MVPRPSSASWNVAEGALDQTIHILTQGESSAKARALLVEARRLRSRIASWRAIPPSPGTRKEAFESAMHLLRKAGEMPVGGSNSSMPPPSAAVESPRKPPSSGPADSPRKISSGPPVESPRKASSGPVESPRRAPASPPPEDSASLPPPRAPSIPPQPRAYSSVAPARQVSSAPPGMLLGPKQESISPGVTVFRQRSFDWRPFHFLEGVEMKILHREESGLFRAVFRLAPGAEIPRHRHTMPEDLLILDGSLVVDGLTLRGGELCHAEKGSIHAACVAPSGCTYLVIGAETNEIFWD